MSTPVVNTQDPALYNIVSNTQAGSIADVIATMKSIDGLLPENDGLKWFNKLYLMVTDDVNAKPPGGGWQSPAWLEHLDIVFAGIYFKALANYVGGREIASSWSALFESRFRSGIDRIQFAVAGMNAHINHDLALALVETGRNLNIVPAEDGPERADFESVNQILEQLIPSVLQMLAIDQLGYLAQDTGKIGRILAFWKVRQARDLAWDFAGHLRNLRGLPYDTALDLQDSLTGALGRAILLQV